MQQRKRYIAAVVGMAALLQLAGCGDNDNTITLTDCGNGAIEGSEQCDDGNSSDSDGCLTTCRTARCGDGFLRLDTEECDGNQLGGETCTSLGESSGTLACNTDCTFNVSGCTGGGNPTPVPTTVNPTPTATPGTGPTSTDGGSSPTVTPTPTGTLCVAGDTIEATVNVAQTYGGLVVSIAYPASLNIPGNGSASSVGARVITKPSGGLQSPADNDENPADGVDDTFRYSFADTTLQTPGPFITVEFDCIPGEAAPSDLPCTVESASDELGTSVDGVTCTTAVVKKP